MKKRNYLLAVVAATLFVATGWSNCGNKTELPAPETPAVEAQAASCQAAKAERAETTAKASENMPGRDYVEPAYTGKSLSQQLLRRTAYSTSYNKTTRTPNWVGWVLTAAHTDGPYGRKGHKFAEDTDVPAPRATYDDIREGECGYQRGHMCPAGDNKWSFKAQQEAFLMTNICPQDGDLNQRDWKYLEEACRDWAQQYGKVYIVAGPIFNRKPRHTVGEHKVAVPDAFFKVILAFDGTSPKAIGFLYSNASGRHAMAHYAKSVDEIERLTHFDFFRPLPDSVETRVEAECAPEAWGMN